jgi:hypothetical protein
MVKLLSEILFVLQKRKNRITSLVKQRTFGLQKFEKLYKHKDDFLCKKKKQNKNQFEICKH